MELQRIFGKNIKYYRFQKKLTQQELAEKVDLSVNYISQLENGQHSADFSVIERLCKVLGIEPFQLFLTPKDVNFPRRIDMV